MDFSFAQVPHAYPSHYKIKLDQLQELQTLYTEVVLPRVTVSEVECELSKYVSSFIEPVGWCAIWRANTRSSGLSFKVDLLVEVIDVARNKLEALVKIVKVLSSQLDLDQEFDLLSDEERADHEELAKFMEQKRILTAPLIELYVVNERDSEEAFVKTAIVIEHARFFLKYIWRPWDTISAETQLSEIFVETRLESRLNLYFDLKNGIIGETQRKRVKQILVDGWELRHQLDDISLRQELSALEEDDEDEDKEREPAPPLDLCLDEVDMFEAMRLKLRLEDLDREMRMLEDPYLRMFAFALRSQTQDEEEAKVDLEQERVLHVVSRQFSLFTLGQITNYYAKSEQDQQCKLMFHSSLNAAIKAARKGHKIALLPAHYICESLSWIEHDIEIEGLSSDRTSIVIQATHGVDVLLHSSSQLTIRNVTLKCPFESDCLIMIHAGLLNLVNCCLDGSNCAKGAFVLLSRAKISLNNSQVINREIVNQMDTEEEFTEYKAERQNDQILLEKEA